jgi:hypothetical protein
MQLLVSRPSVRCKNFSIVCIVYPAQVNINCSRHHFLFLLIRIQILSKGIAIVTTIQNLFSKDYLFVAKLFAITGHIVLKFVRFEVPFLVHIQCLKSSQNLVLGVSPVAYSLLC